VLYAGTLIGAGLFAITGHLGLAVAAWLIVSGFQDIGSPVAEAWLNQNIPSSARATVLSLNSQVDLLGQMGGSTSLSVVGDHYGVRSALGLAGAWLVPLLAIYSHQARTGTEATERP
jgi:MFS transporter, DHA3 family, tetracycline resistance protein